MRHEYLHHSNHAKNQNYYESLHSNDDDNSNLDVHFAPQIQIQTYDPTVCHSDTGPSCESVLIPALPCNPDLHSRDTGEVIIDPFSIQSDRLCDLSVPIWDSDCIGTSVRSF